MWDGWWFRLGGVGGWGVCAVGCTCGSVTTNKGKFEMITTVPVLKDQRFFFFLREAQEHPWYMHCNGLFDFIYSDIFYFYCSGSGCPLILHPSLFFGLLRFGYASSSL